MNRTKGRVLPVCSHTVVSECGGGGTGEVPTSRTRRTRHKGIAEESVFGSFYRLKSTPTPFLFITDKEGSTVSPIGPQTSTLVPECPRYFLLYPIGSYFRPRRGSSAIPIICLGNLRSDSTQVERFRPRRRVSTIILHLTWNLRSVGTQV